MDYSDPDDPLDPTSSSFDAAIGLLHDQGRLDGHPPTIYKCCKIGIFGMYVGGCGADLICPKCEDGEEMEEEIDPDIFHDMSDAQKDAERLSSADLAWKALESIIKDMEQKSAEASSILVGPEEWSYWEGWDAAVEYLKSKLNL